MTQAPPARIVYVTPTGERDAIGERLEAEWPSLSLLVTDGVASAVETVDPDVDAVLTHMDLSDGTGLDLQQQLNPADCSIPVVLLVGETTPEIAAAAVQSEVAGYVPVDRQADADRVVTVLRDAIGERPDQVTAIEDLVPRGGQNMAEWKALLLDQLFTRLPVHLFVKDREGRHVLISNSLVDNPDDYLGLRDIDGEFVPESEARPAYEDDMRVIETGEPIIDKEEYYPSLDRWLLTSKVPLYGPDGEITGLMGAGREITDHKETERELVRSNERLDRFASVVSHDLRNPLSVADGNLQLLQEDYDDERLDAIEEALDRMESLIEELLTLARQGVQNPDVEPVSLDEIATECWARVATDNASLSAEGSTPFLADRTQIQQLFENLFTNAIEHAGSDVSVTVGPLADSEGFYVADDGPGIPDDDVDAVFEPGYTTTTEGTGFGLHIVREVARDHGWEASVTDSEADGARFEITDLDRPS